MMVRSKIGMYMDDALSDIDFEAVSEEEENKCSDDIWNYYEDHKDDAVDLEEYARKRGIKI